MSGVSAAKGYSEKIARQYVEIQQLKSNYIRSFLEEAFYRNLLVDIMIMSIYHSYRIGVSPQLSSILKKNLQCILLTRTFASPTGRISGKKTIKYILLRSFFVLPIAFKRTVINICGCLHLKDKVRRWSIF